MTLKKLLSDTAQVLIPWRYVGEGFATKRSAVNNVYTIIISVSLASYGVNGCDTGFWTLSGQSQVKQERAADREQLRSLVDSDGNGVSLQEYNKFREATESNPTKSVYSSRLARDIENMEPEEVEDTIRKYAESEQ